MYSHFSGHLGHLTSSEQDALERFKVKLVEAGVYTPSSLSGDLKEEGKRASHDDVTLLRFLRARRFDPTRALKQFSDTEAWRKEHSVEMLYVGFAHEEFESSKRFYPRWTGRRDKDGRPLYVYRLASIAPLQRELNAIPPARRYQRIVALYELMTLFVLPLCTYLPHPTSTTTPPTPISSVTTIIDLDQVSFASMWNLRSVLQEASKLATANYPETLDSIAVVNSPGFFPRVWGWISAWFDEGTRNKIHILGKGSGIGETLLKLVDKENLPVQYGGEMEWRYEDEPWLDGPAGEVLGSGVDGMLKGPVVFRDGRVVRADVDSIDGRTDG